MQRIHRRIASAAISVMLAAAPAAAYAAAEDPGLAPDPHSKRVVVPLEYAFGKEMVVRNWVLCVSQPVAESIVKAWSGGVERAEAVYADLKAQKSCGQFPELHVILHESVYQSGPEVDHAAGVFAAQINLNGAWPNGFVVYGGLPEKTPAQ